MARVKHSNPNPLAATRRIVAELGRYRVRVGWAQDMGADPKTVQIAAINMLGAPAANIPARDALTPMIQAEKLAIRSALGHAAKAALRGRDPTVYLEGLAAHLEQRAKSAIEAFSDPPNAPSTIRQKGADDPLIGKGSDGGRLLAQVAARVSKR
jgi:hypothetical protein